jgi:kynurenine formamidase
MGSLPSYQELPLSAGLRSSWGVWGEIGTDRFGCLNLLTPERAASAAQLVRRGAAFPLNWTMELPKPALFDRATHTHEVTAADNSPAHDDVLHDWNTQSSSQWDGFRHIRNFKALDEEPGTGHYGGVADEELGIDHWARRGIVGRAVLADIGRYREHVGRPMRYAESDIIDADELLDCLAHQGTMVEEGDILLMRTGWVGWYESHTDPAERLRLSRRADLTAPGLSSVERTCEVLWDLHIAAIGADNPSVEVWPPSADMDPAERAVIWPDLRRRHEAFVHMRLLPMLGLPLGEMWNLDPLADDCAADGRYECFFTSAPLNLANGVASPPNAIALK